MAVPAQARTSYLVKRVELIVRNRLEAALQELEITTGQYAVLSLLAAMPEVSSAQLARAVGVTPQTMTETIVAFEKRELIGRERSEAHKRILKITLTTAGRSLLKQCEAQATLAEKALFAGLSSKDLSRFRSLLFEIIASDENSRD